MTSVFFQILIKIDSSGILQSFPNDSNRKSRPKFASLVNDWYTNITCYDQRFVSSIGLDLET